MKYQAVIYTNVYEDNYNLGELDEVNYWTETVTGNSPKDLLENIKNSFIDEDAILYLNQDNINEYKDSNEYWTSYQVNENNEIPSATEIKDWKAGKIKLYVANVHILVSKVTNNKALLPKIKVVQ